MPMVGRLAVVLLAATAACERAADAPPALVDLRAEYADRLAGTRAGLAATAAALPARGSVRRSHCSAPPEPRPANTFSFGSNMVVMMDRQLGDPAAVIPDSVMNLSLYPPVFARAVRLMTATDTGGRGVEPITANIARRQLDSAFALPWLVVVRPVRVVMPVVRGSDDFTGGAFEAEVFLVDRRTGSITCAFAIRDRAPVVSVPVAGPGEDERRALYVAARTAVYERAATSMRDSLIAVAGAAITR